MGSVKHFLQTTEIRSYSLQGFTIELELTPAIFPPSPFGSFFAENITVFPGESVLDIGTGSGILGILAAKLGGSVSATDIDPDALLLAEKNALRNQVSIECAQGGYFASFQKKFDVILANLPQEIVHPDYQGMIGEKLNNTISGGPLGNGQILELLSQAGNYMHQNTRLYIIINTVTNYAASLKKALSLYSAQLVNFSSGPTKEFVKDNIEWYLELNKDGIIKIFEKDGEWYADDYLLELRLS